MTESKFSDFPYDYKIPDRPIEGDVFLSSEATLTAHEQMIRITEEMTQQVPLLTQFIKSRQEAIEGEIIAIDGNPIPSTNQTPHTQFTESYARWDAEEKEHEKSIQNFPSLY